MKIFRTLVLALAFVFVSFRAFAQDSHWSGLGSSDASWTDHLNWEGYAVPAEGDNAYLQTESGVANYPNTATVGAGLSNLYLDNSFTLNLMPGSSLAAQYDEILGSADYAGFISQTGGLNTVFGNLEVNGVNGGDGKYYLDDAPIYDEHDPGSIIGFEPGVLDVKGKVTAGALENGYGIIGQDGPISSVTVGQDLVLGAGLNSHAEYDLDDGTLHVLGNEIIGQVGYGIFNHPSGTNHVTGDLILGNQKTFDTDLGDFVQSQGKYELSGSGSVLTVDGNETIGMDGIGDFHQLGGVHTVGAGLPVPGILALGQNPGSSGTYTLEGGSLQANWENVGFNGSGTFTQNGGTNTDLGSLFLGVQGSSLGTYILSGSSSDPNAPDLSVAWEEEIGQKGHGIFYHYGGYNKSNNLLVGVVPGSWGDYYQYNGNVLTDYAYLGGSALTGDLGGTGNFHQGVPYPGGGSSSGGIAVVNYDMAIGWGGDSSNKGVGNYYLDNGYLLVGADLTVGKKNRGYGSVYQTNGSVGVGGALILGDESGSVGSYSLSNGILAAANEYIGNNSSGDGLLPGGTFTQSGGTNYIGYDIYGTAIQDGNLHELIVGRFGPAVGQYLLQGGELHASRELVGDAGGSGYFKQNNNAQHYVDNDLIIGQDPGPGGTFSLADSALLSVGNDILIGDEGGTGKFTQTGGSVTVKNGLHLGSNSEGGLVAGSSGTYKLGDEPVISTEFVSLISPMSLYVGPQLTVGHEVVGGQGTGYFYQYGGTHRIIGDNERNVDIDDGKIYAGSTAADGLVVGDAADSYGRFELDGGSLSSEKSILVDGQGAPVYQPGGNDADHLTWIGGSEEIGSRDGVGEFYQYGGSNTAESMDIGAGGSRAGKGYYEQNGGFVTVNSWLGIDSKWADGSEVGPSKYVLKGGTLDKLSFETKIGGTGYGYFEQSGGTFNQDGAMYLGDQLGSYGRYTMTGGTLNGGDTVLSEWGGTGEFYQSGGTADFNSLTLARQFDPAWVNPGRGYYQMDANADGNPDPILIANSLTVGDKGIGLFVQNAGTVTVNGDLDIQAQSGSLGQYDFNGGSLSAGLLTNNGSFNVNGGSPLAPLPITGDVLNNGAFTVKADRAVSVSGTFTNSGVLTMAKDPAVASFYDLVVPASGTLHANDGEIHVSGDLQLDANNVHKADWDTANATLVLESSGGKQNVAFNSVDLGATLDGFVNNFAWGTVKFGNNSFSVISDYGPNKKYCVLYVTNFLDDGFDPAIQSYVVNITGMANIYYRYENGKYNSWLKGGTYGLGEGLGQLIPVNAVPEPISSALFLLGGATLAMVRGRRKTS